MEQKKIAIFYILHILQCYSSKEKPLTQKQILSLLESDYEIRLERKAIGSNVGVLRAAGFPVVSVPRRGVYYEKRHMFQEGELQMLIDSVAFSRYLTEEQCKSLLWRLREQADEKFNNSVMAPLNFQAFYAPPAQGILETLPRLNEAIAAKRKVTFVYCGYGVGIQEEESNDEAYKELRPVWDAPKTVSPYQIVVANGNYYLIGNLDEEDTLAHFRLDKIAEISLTGIPCKPFHAIREGKNVSRFEIEGYLATHPFMREGELGSVIVRVDKHQIGKVIDAFGRGVRIQGSDDRSFDILLRAGLEDVYDWALQNGDCVEVLEPQKLRNRMRGTASLLKKKYLSNRDDRYALALEEIKLRRSLRLEGVSVKNRIALEDLPQELFSVEFYETDLADIRFLAKYRDLKALRIVRSPVADAGCVASFPALKALTLCSTRVSSLSFLRGIKLEELVLADDPIQDFSPLYEMDGLDYFTADGETMRKIDRERLFSRYPGIVIEENDDLVRSYYDGEYGVFDERAAGEYPLNLLEAVFREGSAECIGSRQELERSVLYAVHTRLSKEDAQLLADHFQKKKTLNEMARLYGLLPDIVLSRMAKAMRKLSWLPFRTQLAGVVKFTEEEPA